MHIALILDEERNLVVVDTEQPTPTLLWKWTEVKLGANGGMVRHQHVIFLVLIRQYINTPLSSLGVDTKSSTILCREFRVI